mmetsp:Transcript_613/g.852  ORF Transcript_613/g.852 Transcript_613/m.852 type:complete len:103 (-) Transcript_613:410-718(-)
MPDPLEKSKKVIPNLKRSCPIFPKSIQLPSKGSERRASVVKVKSKRARNEKQMISYFQVMETLSDIDELTWSTHPSIKRQPQRKITKTSGAAQFNKGRLLYI